MYVCKKFTFFLYRIISNLSLSREDISYCGTIKQNYGNRWSQISIAREDSSILLSDSRIACTRGLSNTPLQSFSFVARISLWSLPDAHAIACVKQADAEVILIVPVVEVCRRPWWRTNMLEISHIGAALVLVDFNTVLWLILCPAQWWKTWMKRVAHIGAGLARGISRWNEWNFL